MSAATGLRTVEEHLDLILAEVRRLPALDVPLAEAAGLTLARPVAARIDIPPFDNSAMDGFAVRYDDVAAADAAPPTLRVIADLPAGTAEDPALRPGEAARIMTGAPVPAHADAIVPFEDTRDGLAGRLAPVVVERAPAARGAFIRRRGDDLRAGDEVLPAGEPLGALSLAAAAAAGVAGTVSVVRRPRAVIVSTGAELAEPGAALSRGRIPDSNATLLAALVRGAGGEVVRIARVGDDTAGLRAVIADAASADVVITSGGVSEGAYEVVKTVLSGRVEFAKVAMQPGKPQAFGRLGGGPLVFGLPGNPVSVAVSFEVFVRPALLAMQGRNTVLRPVIRLAASAGWRTPPGRRQYLPAAVDRDDPARWTVRPATAGGSGSHLAGGLARAEAYAVVPADVALVATGDPVDVMLLS
ncbi:molybdopterin molybdotransferase MoeA [Microbacterium betulae]|uniref:Molybdopterin molybdenumtransferase n=1 Tax=Microbacterium betulae TaxID=2981139 RepID=A0AA97FNI2_9MICO|nr:gephyrin-like molybdotransferase Glp [Microbacterium sp. AB]WOF24637.1 molybdopterin molybdotransferase MoeA [Microbacterium sp. AB]